MSLDTFADTILAFVKEHRAWAPVVMLVLAFGESIAFVSLILPFWALLVGVGTMIGTGSGEFWIVLTAAAIGAALGDWLSYWLGFHYHEQIARTWPLSKYPDLLPQGRRVFDRWGVWAIVLARFSGPLRASVPIVAGAVQMPKWPFQIANWLSAFLWAGVLLIFGDAISRVFPYVWSAIKRGLAAIGLGG